MTGVKRGRSLRNKSFPINPSNESIRRRGPLQSGSWGTRKAMKTKTGQLDENIQLNKRRTNLWQALPLFLYLSFYYSKDLQSRGWWIRWPIIRRIQFLVISNGKLAAPKSTARNFSIFQIYWTRKKFAVCWTVYVTLGEVEDEKDLKNPSCSGAVGYKLNYNHLTSFIVALLEILLRFSLFQWNLNFPKKTAWSRTCFIGILNIYCSTSHSEYQIICQLDDGDVRGDGMEGRHIDHIKYEK